MARSDFYEKVEAIVSPKKTTNGLNLSDISAFWVPGIGMKCSQVLRLLRKTSAKSAVPVFEWKKENNVNERQSFGVFQSSLAHQKGQRKVAIDGNY